MEPRLVVADVSDTRPAMAVYRSGRQWSFIIGGATSKDKNDVGRPTRDGWAIISDEDAVRLANEILSQHR
jgi:hypothetical protein